MLQSTTVQISANRTFHTVAAASIIVIALAGCGGGGDSTGPTLTRTAFLTRANAICADTAARIKNGAASVFPRIDQLGQQDLGQIRTYATTVVLPALQKEYADLQALRPPPDNNPVQTLGELEKAIDRWENDKTIMAQDNDTSFARFDTLAADFGLSSCSGTDKMVRGITGGTPNP